jgi:hypothetical protein
MRTRIMIFLVVVALLSACGFPPASPASSPLSSAVAEKFEKQIELLEEELGVPAQRSERAGFCAGKIERDEKCAFYFQGFGEVKPSSGKSRFWVVLVDDPSSINVLFCLYERFEAGGAWMVIQDMPFVIGYEQYPLTKDQFQRLLATGVFEEIPEAVG